MGANFIVTKVNENVGINYIDITLNGFISFLDSVVVYTIVFLVTHMTVFTITQYYLGKFGVTVVRVGFEICFIGVTAALSLFIYHKTTVMFDISFWE
tara:strand:+ start:188 stop:478 length:291 start_codon:yes stop_codon:yes gene_type:complete